MDSCCAEESACGAREVQGEVKQAFVAILNATWSHQTVAKIFVHSIIVEYFKPVAL